MKIFIALISALFFSALAIAQSTKLPTVIKKIEGFKHPESVAYDGKFFYVSNLGNVLDPTAKDGDGFISKLNRYGEIVEYNAFPNIKLNSPKGLIVMDEILFLTDVDSVMGIDVKTKKVIWGRTFYGTKYINDILGRDQETIYVSATDKNVVYEIDLLSDSVRTITMPVELSGANGLSDDLISSNLYIAFFGSDETPGEIGRYNIRTNQYEKALDIEGRFDGIFYAAGRYYMSDWGKDNKGRLLLYDIRTEEIREIKPDQGYFQGPADFYVEIPSRKIWLPCMLENAVYILNSR